MVESEQIEVRWSTEGQKPGWIVRVEVEPGRLEWMSPAPGHDCTKLAEEADLEAMARDAWRYHATPGLRGAAHRLHVRLHLLG